MKGAHGVKGERGGAKGMSRGGFMKTKEESQGNEEDNHDGNADTGLVLN